MSFSRQVQYILEDTSICGYRPGLDVNNLNPDNAQYATPAIKFPQGGMLAQTVDQLEHWDVEWHDVSDSCNTLCLSE